jgi:hypothetical protein
MKKIIKKKSLKKSLKEKIVFFLSLNEIIVEETSALGMLMSQFNKCKIAGKIRRGFCSQFVDTLQ